MLRLVSRQAGTTMMEVLVSIVIVVIGLLGLAGLQSRASVSEMEAFQRAQALVLLQDMADRINANRKLSMDYVTTAPLGTGNSSGVVTPCTGTIAERDLCEWQNALLGAAETTSGVAVGAMIGARGCVTNITPTMPREFQIAVVWQGLVPTAAPGATLCGSGDYGDDRTRRAVTANVIIGCLQNNLANGLCITP
jgi:type IV pilus assembly protein PilV